MIMNKVLGAVLLVVGAIVLAFGINATQAVPEQAMEAVSGKYTENTMIYILAGVAMVVGGIVVLWRNPKI